MSEMNWKNIRINSPKDLEGLTLPDELFETISADEKKKSAEDNRKSVTYWQDAWRRFKANKVAMVASVIFILILIFAFAGPVVIPYSYESQYRNSAKLGPMEYSETEIEEQNVLKNYDAIFCTNMMEGSLKSLSKGSYYIKAGGTKYYFTREKSLSNSYILYDKDSEEKLFLASSKDVQEDGTFTEITPLDCTTDAIEGATQVTLITKVVPHVLGTDSAGRDIMSRCMYGTRVSLIIGIAAALIVLVIGAAIGAFAGLAGGKVDFVIMRIIDIIISIPSTLMVLLLQVVLSAPLQAWFDSSHTKFAKAMGDLGVGIVSMFIVFALLYWVSMARLVRGQVLQLKGMEFITAEEVLGAENKRIILRHLLPNCVGQLVIATCLQIPSAIFTESFLSYLGIGVAAPMASLGSMCSEALATLSVYPYRLICPALILSVLVLSLNLIGDGLRDALDPRLK